MKISASEINTYILMWSCSAILYSWLGREFRLVASLELLSFRRQTFHVPNLTLEFLYRIFAIVFCFFAREQMVADSVLALDFLLKLRRIDGMIPGGII